MKKLILAMTMLVSFSSLATTCTGKGYTVSVNGGSIHVAGNGLNFTASAKDFGSYFSANVGAQGIRSVTLAPFNGKMTLVKNRGVETVNGLNCN